MEETQGLSVFADPSSSATPSRAWKCDTTAPSRLAGVQVQGLGELSTLKGLAKRALRGGCGPGTVGCRGGLIINQLGSSSGRLLQCCGLEPRPIPRFPKAQMGVSAAPSRTASGPRLGRDPYLLLSSKPSTPPPGFPSCQSLHQNPAAVLTASRVVKSRL